MKFRSRLKARVEAKSSFSNEARFLRNWLRNPLKTGAVLPSSRALAAAMARPVPVGDLGPDGVVVELGPGTGVVTHALLEAGVPPERLVLLEYSADFCALLSARLPGAEIVEGDAYAPGPAFETALAGRPIAAIVSSLPLMTKPEPEREAALLTHLARLRPGAPFVQFTYSPTLPVRPERVEAVVETSPWVMRNLPPARVLVYRRGGATGGLARGGRTL